MGKGRDKRRKHEDPAKAARRAARQASKALKHDGKKAAGSGEAASADAEQQLSYSSTARTPAAMLHGFNNEEAIETTLKRIQKAQSKCKTIEERANVPPPSPRVNAVLLPHPDRPHELLLFGGEYWDGATTTAYNDTYFYHLKRRTWSQLVSAVQPPPRSSAQAVTYKHYVVLFGGEFVSQSQSQYLHFRDVWRYDARRSEWSEVKPAKSLTLSSHGNSVSVGSGASGPSARSGHRMVLWRRQAVLFGGFYDNAQECHYYNDLWLLSSLDAVVQWTRVTTQATTTAATAAATAGDAAPHPRSGHGMAVYKDTLFVYGGYSTERFNRFKKSEATVHHDLWMLQLPTTTTTASGSAATATEQGQRDDAEDGGGGSGAVAAHGRTRATSGGVHAVWVKVRLGGVPPPIRAGVAVAFRDKRMYLFGGVVDIESPGGKLVSTFYNDLFVFHMDSRRFYPVVLRPSTRRGKANATVTATTSAASRHGQRHDNNDSDDDDNDNTRGGGAGTMTTRRGGVDNLAAELAALQLQPARTQQQQQQQQHKNSSSTGHSSDDDSNDDDDDTDGGVVQASETMKVSYEVRRGGVVYPHRRMDAAVTIVDNTLYVYGGQFESGEREVTMSDLFALHLGRLDGYEVLLSQDLSAAVWLGPGDDDADGAASNSWESGSTVVSAAFDVMDNDDDDDEDDDDDDNANATAAKATAADIRRALQTGVGGGKRDDSAAASDDDDNNNNANDDDDEAPEAIPVELDMEATPSVIVDAVTHIRGKKGMQQHKARLLAQLSATAAVPTPRQDEAFATFYARTSTFWLRAAQDAGGSDDDDGDGDGDDVKKTTTTAVVSPQRRREAMAFARRRYAEARELLQQLRLVEEHERAEQEFFRERRLQREREWQAATAAAEDDDDDGSDDDDNDDRAERVATHTPPQA